MFVIIGIVYIGYQFKLGYSEASEAMPPKKTTDEVVFQGEEVQFGEIKILLIGSDAREGERGRSDALMIAYYNQDTKQLKIASLMRDSYVEVPGHGMQKLNAAYSFGGPELLRQTVKNNFDIDVNYYAIVDFEGFPKLVDLIAPEGIEVNIEKKMSAGIGMTLDPGKQTLHGKELLGYVRFRKDKLSDFGRVERQQEIVAKVKDQAVRFTSLVRLPRILGTASAYIDTNVDAKTLFSIGKGMITAKSTDVETLRIPIQDSFTDDVVDVGAVLRMDLEENQRALKEFFQ